MAQLKEDSTVGGKYIVEEAPPDGKQYVRKDQSWENVKTTDIGTILIDETGDYSVSGLGFTPSKIKFSAVLPIDGEDTTLTGSGNEDGFSGIQLGFAKDDDGTTVEQSMCTGGSGNSINNIRAVSSSSHCIYVEYADEDGNEIATIGVTLSSWDSDGFTLDCDTYSSVDNVDGLLVMYEAYI